MDEVFARPTGAAVPHGDIPAYYVAALNAGSLGTYKGTRYYNVLPVAGAIGAEIGPIN